MDFNDIFDPEDEEQILEMLRYLEQQMLEGSRSEPVWTRLAAEGRFQLIERLRHAELGHAGYGTIVVPKEGFSDDDTTHNAVLDWLSEHQINVMNVGLEIARLERALET